MSSNEQARMPVIGEHVIYVDPVGRSRSALVTAVWGPTCVNVVMVSSDAACTDNYGRQIARTSSLNHQTMTPAHGNYWRFVDDTPKDTEA